MGLSHQIRYAMSLPPRVALARGWAYGQRRLAGFLGGSADRRRCTFAPVAAEVPTRIVGPVPRQALQAAAADLADLAA